MADFDLQMSAARFAEALLPADELRQQRANAAVISPDGRVDVRSLSDALLVQRVDFHIGGAATTGSNVAQQFEVYQPGTLRRIVAHAKTAPSTSEFTAMLVSGTTAIENVSITAGQSRGISNGHGEEITSGGPLRINVTSAGGAADVTISVFYQVR